MPTIGVGTSTNCKGTTMTIASSTTKAGYFNALTSGAFKVTPDGRRLFFPWGVLGRGYEIPSESDYQRLHRLMKIYVVASLVLIIAPIAAGYMLTGLAMSMVLVAFFVAWTPYLLRGLKP